jgi:hypothetical protein
MNLFLLILNLSLITYVIRDIATKVFPYRSKFKKHSILIEKVPEHLEFWNIPTFKPTFLEVIEVGKRDYLVKDVNKVTWHSTTFEMSKKEINRLYTIAPISELNKLIEEE